LDGRISIFLRAALEPHGSLQICAIEALSHRESAFAHA
jgi:hypothetical protein